MDVIVECATDDYSSLDWIDVLEDALGRNAQRLNDFTLVIRVRNQDPNLLELIEDLIRQGTGNLVNVRFQLPY